MNLYQQILRETDNLDGWAEQGKRIALALLVKALDPKVIVEVGVWGGKSLMPMAMAASEDATIYAIDPWSASESVKGQEEKDANWWGKEIGQPHHEAVYRKFIGKLMELGLRDDVIIKRCTSDEFLPPADIDLCHLDGNHGPQAFRDTQRLAPNISVGGVMVLDDLDWTGGNVGKAAEWLKNNGFLELHPLGTGAVFMRMK